MNESNFKEISIVPDYRALEIILNNKKELQGFFQEGEPIIKEICREPSYGKFRKQLADVEDYLKNKATKVPQLNSEIAKEIGEQLRMHFDLSKEEIVMILNQLPLNEGLLEMMFPGKFTKEQLSIINKLINLNLGLPDDSQPEDVSIKVEADTDIEVNVKQEI